MKAAFFLLFILCAASAFGQTAPILPNQPQILAFTDHSQHASPHSLATEQPIIGGSIDTYTSAHGERPLWEFGPLPEGPSLGDVARAYRKEKETGKKAEFVFEKQGS